MQKSSKAKIYRMKPNFTMVGLSQGWQRNTQCCFWGEHSITLMFHRPAGGGWPRDRGTVLTSSKWHFLFSSQKAYIVPHPVSELCLYLLSLNKRLWLFFRYTFWSHRAFETLCKYSTIHQLSSYSNHMIYNEDNEDNLTLLTSYIQWKSRKIEVLNHV